MKLYQFAIVVVVLVVLREVSGYLIYRFTEVAPLAKFGSLGMASFLAGWLASSIGTRPPTDRQLLSLAALGVIASISIDLIQGAPYLALAVIFMLIVDTPISYVCLILGAKLAESGTKGPPPQLEDGHEAAPNA
jgi:hypothetical protein